jgi:hypothetical protein
MNPKLLDLVRERLMQNKLQGFKCESISGNSLHAA